jgi:hypothetical protein
VDPLQSDSARLRRIRRARITWAVVTLILVLVAPDPLLRALAGVSVLLWLISAAIVPRAGTVYLIPTESGVQSRLFGLITWDEIAAVNVREGNHGRCLEIFDRDRKVMIRRARPRLLQAWMFLTQPLDLPLLRITEDMASFDAMAYRQQLEQLAGRSLPQR